MNTDFYACLGVAPDAEAIVVTAAYRALAAKYHPDRWKGSPEVAHERMAAINEAYATLSDVSKRAEYDRRNASTWNKWRETTGEQNEAFDEGLAELEAKWRVAARILPIIDDIRNQLKKTSYALEFQFVQILVEKRLFNDAGTIAEKMEKDFLERHFGRDKKIIAFARYLISQGNRAALKELNSIVDVLGDGIDSGLIINQICIDFKIDKKGEIEKYSDFFRMLELENLLRTKDWDWVAIDLAKYKGFNVINAGGIFFSCRIQRVIDGAIVADGLSKNELLTWARANLLD